MCVGGTYEQVIEFEYNLAFNSWEGAKEACEEKGMVMSLPGDIYENEQLRKFSDDMYPRPQSVRQNPGEAENWVCVCDLSR